MLLDVIVDAGTFGSKAQAFSYTADGEDSDVEEVTRRLWGVTVETESSSEEESVASEDSQSQDGSLPSGGSWDLSYLIICVFWPYI